MTHFGDSSLAVRTVVCLSLAYVVYSIAISLSTWRRRQAMKQEKGCQEVPWLVNQWDRILGIDLFLQTSKAVKNHEMMADIQRTFLGMGVNTMQFVTLGVHMSRTLEPENLKTIQAINHTKWGLPNIRKDAFIPLLGKGIFTNDGTAWQHSRDMLRPNFVRSQIGDVLTFEKHISQLISIINKSSTVGVDLCPLFFRLTLDSSTEFLFGESTHSLRKDSNQDLRSFGEAFDEGTQFVAHQVRFGKLTRIFPGKNNFKENQKVVHDFVDRYVVKALAEKSRLGGEKPAAENGRYVFIDELVRQTSDPVIIRSELLNILLAGRDTTASLLTNVWFILSQRPDIWSHLQAEVAKLDGARPTFEQLKNLKYLKAVLNESLRLHPVVPNNSRQALEDTTLPVGGGADGRSPFFVKKGGVVSWNVYALHRRKDLYGDDAEEFKPERWLDDPKTGKKGLRPGWEYLPFNGGARICLGQQFALAEASYVTVRLCQAFSDIECKAPGPWTEDLHLTCVNLSGAKVALTPRGT